VLDGDEMPVQATLDTYVVYTLKIKIAIKICDQTDLFIKFDFKALQNFFPGRILANSANGHGLEKQNRHNDKQVAHNPASSASMERKIKINNFGSRLISYSRPVNYVI
jgi:hypothetical protein